MRDGLDVSFALALASHFDGGHAKGWTELMAQSGGSRL